MQVFRIFNILCGLCILNLFLLPVRMFVGAWRDKRRQERAEAERAAARASTHSAAKVTLEKPAEPPRKRGRPRKALVAASAEAQGQRPAIIPAPRPAPTRAASDWEAQRAEWNRRHREAADACDAILAARGLDTTRKEGTEITFAQFAATIS